MTPSTVTQYPWRSSSLRSSIAVFSYSFPPLLLCLPVSALAAVHQMAEAVVRGATEAGAEVTLYQVAETLPPEVLQKMYAAPKPTDVPIITPDDLVKYDGIMFGAPTRYGQPAAQYKALWDATGQLWSKGALDGKLAGFFFGTASLGGGQETTASSNMGHFVHHGMIFVPMGYGDPSKVLFDLDTVHGGSPWGAGTLSGPTGARQPSKAELGMAEYHGKRFATFANQFVRGKAQ
jgi:NAD(P)H dehydrogenase (quinone)